MNANPANTPDTTKPNEEQELCIQCLNPNQPGTDFCRTCGAPLSSFASTGPFERLFAEGHAYRHATEQPRNMIVVLGIWMIFGTLALTGGVFAVESWSSDSFLRVSGGTGVVLVSLILIWKTTRNYLRRKLPQPG